MSFKPKWNQIRRNVVSEKVLRGFSVRVTLNCQSSRMLVSRRRRFGVIHIDYEGGTLARTPKKSAEFFKQVASTWHVPLVEASGSSQLAAPVLAVLAALSLHALL